MSAAASPARLASCAAIAVALLATASGCGDDEPEREVTGVGQVSAGSVAPLAQCRDWNAGSDEERQATIEDIRSQLNPEDAPVKTNELSDERAYEVFESGCAPAGAETVRLYLLYARAAAFEPLLEP